MLQKNGTQLREPFKTVRHYLLFSLACTPNTHSHSNPHTFKDYLHKILWFFDNSCNNPSAVCLCSLYLCMVSMGSLQTFNTNFWLMVLIPHPLTRTLMKRPGIQEEAKKFTHNFPRNQYTFPPTIPPSDCWYSLRL